MSTTRQSRRRDLNILNTLNTYIEAPLNKFLRNINYDEVIATPFDNDPGKAAAHARNGLTFKILTGKGLLKFNVEKEAQRQQLQLHRQNVINLATKKIWESTLSHSQRNEFEDLAKNANTTNRNLRIYLDDIHGRTSQINTHQVTANDLHSDFYNGTNF
jgi:hypothetical protein